MRVHLRQLISLIALVAISLIPASCGKDDDSVCDAEARTVSQAGQLYAAQQSTDNCLIYKRAIQTYLASPCSNSLSSSDRLQLQNIFNNLPC